MDLVGRTKYELTAVIKEPMICTIIEPNLKWIIEASAYTVPRKTVLHHHLDQEHKTNYETSRGKYRLAEKSWDVMEIVAYSSSNMLVGETCDTREKKLLVSVTELSPTLGELVLPGGLKPPV